MRHDFGDQIQVRYQQGNREHFDTWVSGSEALQRLESIEIEQQIRSLSGLDADDLRIVVESLPESAKLAARQSLREELADRLESGIGGNLIGDALADALRSRKADPTPGLSETDRWRALIRYESFRQTILELAWIQLEGSFPDSGTEPPSDDWY